MFAFVAGFVAKDADTNDLSVLQTVNFIFAAMMFVMSKVLPALIMKGQVKFQNNETAGAGRILNKIQVAHLLRLATVEAAALFGSVCVLLGLGFIN